MTTGARQVAASNQRQRIPNEAAIGLEDLTNEELAWRSVHHEDARYRAYAGWELEYRETFGLETYIDHDSGELRRRQT